MLRRVLHELRINRYMCEVLMEEKPGPELGLASIIFQQQCTQHHDPRIEQRPNPINHRSLSHLKRADIPPS